MDLEKDYIILEKIPGGTIVLLREILKNPIKYAEIKLDPWYKQYKAILKNEGYDIE